MLEPPASAVLVEAFANTLDVDEGTDALADPRGLAAWLEARGLLGPADAVGPEEHVMGVRLRDGIRELLGVGVGDTPDPRRVAEADEVLRALPVRVALGAAPLLPDPGLPPARRALAALAVAWSELVTTGDAARLKRCAEHSCAWVFWDVSKNRSRRWCSMRVCGNRAKARRFAAARRGPAPPDG
ncbi:CGNR zinc finger domain-containing protein [Streptomyces capparidis]